MNNPRGRWMAAGLLAALCIGCLGALFGGTREAGYRFLWAAALAALTVLGGRCLNLPDRRERRCFMALGALMAGAQALGLRLELSGYTGVTGLLLCVGAGVGAAYRVPSGARGSSAMGRVQTAVTATIARQALSTHK